jgi:hypothetical protein
MSKLFSYARPIKTWLTDRKSNKLHATAEKRFLVVRHGLNSPGFYDIILEWVADNLPDSRKYFELHQLPCRIQDWSQYCLHIPWLQDPVQQWSMRAYRQAATLSTQCDAHGISVINRVENLINASKSNGAHLIGKTGVRTPVVHVINNIDEFKRNPGGRDLPLIIRDDWGHQRDMHLVTSADQIHDIDFTRFTRPIAVEYIDTRDQHDGLFRKYRYVAVGDIGITLSMHVRKHWLVRGKDNVRSDSLREEEARFISRPDPSHDRLQRARQALELDFVAFDYSYDERGDLIVWEANPYPYIHLPRKNLNRRAAYERVIAAMVKLYLNKAGLPEDPEINKILLKA